MRDEGEQNPEARSQNSEEQKESKRFSASSFWLLDSDF
jgi:hypothetical protein